MVPVQASALHRGGWGYPTLLVNTGHMSLRSLERQGSGHHGTLYPPLRSCWLQVLQMQQGGIGRGSWLYPGVSIDIQWREWGQNKFEKEKCRFSRCHPRFSCRAPGKASLVTAPSAGFGVTTSRQPLVDSPKWLLLVVCTEGGWLAISEPCRFDHFLVDLSHFMAIPRSSDKPMLQSNYILWMHPIQIIQYAWKYAVGSFRYIDRWPNLISLESNKSLLATNLDLACFVVPFKSHPVPAGQQQDVARVGTRSSATWFAMDFVWLFFQDQDGSIYPSVT